jgi:hypothetical protein
MKSTELHLAYRHLPEMSVKGKTIKIKPAG